MRRIPEQTSQNTQAVRKNQAKEKKNDSFRGSGFAPECASAAAAEIGRVLGIAADIQTGETLLSGGNQLLLSLMRPSQGSELVRERLPVFAESSPVIGFEPDAPGENAALPAPTAQMPGTVELSAII